MLIRKATLDDLNAIVEFNQAMAEETEGKKLDSNTITAGVKGLLGNAQRGFYLVAEADGVITGSLMVTYEWSDWRNADFWWIQSVYIVPEYRRKGVYSALYKKVQFLAEAADDVCGYRLYVEKENLAAQSTYEALGMAETHYLMYESQ